MRFARFRELLPLLMLVVAVLCVHVVPARMAPPMPSIATSSPVPHSAYCRCKHCPDERSCCCKPSQSLLLQIVRLSACDRVDDLLGGQLRAPCILPRRASLFATPHASVMHFAPCSLSRFQHCPRPLSPPPRLLSVRCHQRRPFAPTGGTYACNDVLSRSLNCLS